MSFPGKSRTNFNNSRRTPLEPSRINGSNCGNIIAVDIGSGWFTGAVESTVTRCERASLLCESVFEDRSDNEWLNVCVDVGAAVESDCWFRTIAIFCQ
jgi:hypothetical protein